MSAQIVGVQVAGSAIGPQAAVELRTAATASRVVQMGWTDSGAVHNIDNSPCRAHKGCKPDKRPAQVSVKVAQVPDVGHTVP